MFVIRVTRIAGVILLITQDLSPYDFYGVFAISRLCEPPQELKGNIRVAIANITHSVQKIQKSTQTITNKSTFSDWYGFYCVKKNL